MVINDTTPITGIQGQWPLNAFFKLRIPDSLQGS